MKAVLFDLFGTLTDNPTEAEVHALHHEIASVLNISPQEYREGWKTTFHDRARGMHATVKESIAAAAACCSTPYRAAGLDRAVEIRIHYTRNWLIPRPDALETIISIRSRGIRTGLLSNCTDEVPMLWPNLEFAAVIDHPLFSSSERLRKPMPEFYERALERMNVKAAECLFVADGDNGELAAARKLGFDVVMIRPSWLLNDYRQNAEEDWEGPRIERLSELIQYLK